MHHPWRELRNRGDGVRLFFTEFTDGRVAATQGTHIYLDRRLLQHERRCAIAHEQAHIDLGDTHCSDPATELIVKRVTARRLITLDRAVDAVRWARDIHEAADCLWVTPEVVLDYLHTLTPGECAQIQDAVLRKDA